MQEREALTDKERLTQLIDELTLQERAVVTQLLQVMVGNRNHKHSVMDIVEMEGTGKELWRMGIDAQDYVNELRGK